MKPKLYLETSIVSYLTGQPSRDVVTLARQQITREWWHSKRPGFALFVSEFVVNEAGLGDPSAAALRLEALAGIPAVQLTPAAAILAEDLLSQGVMPSKAAIDALHVAAAVGAGVEYLLTWNFKHIANAATRARIDRLCRAHGYEPCVICTPEELLEV